MKYLFIICLLSCHNLVAQQTAMFETILFFEDGKGNRDTLTIGYDSAANYLYNPNFGEVILSTPFDPVFEVRATHGLALPGNPHPLLSKKIVGGSEMVQGLNDCYLGEHVVIFPKVTYQPLKIKWKKTDFQGSDCMSNSYLTPDQSPLIVDPPEAVQDLPGLRFGCLSVEDSLVLYLDKEHQAPYEQPFEYIEQNDTILGVALIFSFFPSFSPCNDIVPTQEVTTPKRTLTSLVYPTLTLDNVKLENKGNERIKLVEVVDPSGRILSVLNTNLDVDQSLDIDLTKFTSGLFFIWDRTASGKTNVHRVVKLR